MKTKDIKKMSEGDRKKKLKELELELIKSRVNVAKTGSSKIRNIKKTIAQIHTLNKS